MNTSKLFDLIDPGKDGAMDMIPNNTPKLYPQDAYLIIEEVLSFNDRMKESASRGDHYLWDPFCGNGIIPCTASILFRQYQRYQNSPFSYILATDANSSAITTTSKNLEKTSGSGIERFAKRIDEKSGSYSNKKIERVAELYAYFREKSFMTPIPYSVIKANVLTRECLKKITDDQITMVVTDPPYGKKCEWINGGNIPVSQNETVNTKIALENMRSKLQDNAVVALIMSGYAERVVEILVTTDGYKFQRAISTEKSLKGNRSLYLLTAKGCD